MARQWVHAVAAASLLLASGIGSVRSAGSVLTVQSSDGGAGGACPGPDCTLTGAWNAVGVNGTITLAVSVTIDDTLKLEEGVGWRKIIAEKQGLTLTPSPNFLNSTSAISSSSPHCLTLNGFTISGFTCYGCPSGLIYLYVDGVSTGTPGKLTPGSLPAKPQPSPKTPVNADGSVTPPAPVGILLNLMRMEISGNIMDSPGDSVGLITSYCSDNCSIVMTETTMSNNLVVSTSSFFFGDFIFMSRILGHPFSVTLYLQGVDFVSNTIKGPVHDPPLASILVYGDIYASALQFSGNVMSHGPGAISTGADQGLYGNIYMEYSTIASNVITNGLEGSVIGSSHIHLKEVALDLPAPYTNFVISTDDMYLSSCSFLSGSGKGVLTGFQIFNRDPISKHLVGGSTFANCTQAQPWLPCPAAIPTCRNLKDASGQQVGYKCTRR